MNQRLNDSGGGGGKINSRQSYKIFELDSKAIKEFNKKKYRLNYRLNAFS
jgi:hypothetical protein